MMFSVLCHPVFEVFFTEHIKDRRSYNLDIYAVNLMLISVSKLKPSKHWVGDKHAATVPSPAL